MDRGTKIVLHTLTLVFVFYCFITIVLLLFYIPDLTNQNYENQSHDIQFQHRQVIRDNLTEWMYYTDNCTEDELEKFIDGNYEFYDDFNGCYIRKVVEEEE